MKNKITNTAAMAADPDGGLEILRSAMLSDMIGRRSGAEIEDMEAIGQRELCASSCLPTLYSMGEGRGALVNAGVKFLGTVADDDLFEHVALPEGWRLVPTGHSMWSDLIDERGTVRAKVFYKAAFYDRRAHIDVVA